jgi:hypothetical protein
MIKPRIQWLSVLLYTVYWFALSIIDVPNVAIVERAICIQEYQDPFIDEAACKRSDIQSALANTLGWKLTFNSLAGEYFQSEAGLSRRGTHSNDMRLFSTDGCVIQFYLSEYRVKLTTSANLRKVRLIMLYDQWANGSLGLLTVLYYGSVAERQGKKLVLFLSTCGYMAMVALDVLIC